MTTLPFLIDVNASFGKGATGGNEFPELDLRLKHMDRLGIGRALVWNVESRMNNAGASNRRLFAEFDRTPGAEGRIIPTPTVSGLMTYEAGAVAELKDQLTKRGLRALRFTNVFGRLSLCQAEPVIRAIRQLKPFIIMRHDETNLQDVLDFTDIFPEIPIVVTEVMWGPCINLFDLMRRRRNIVADISWLHSDGAIELAVKHFGAARVVFGTGNKCHNGAAVAALARAEISQKDREMIACGNLQRLLGGKSKPAAAGRAVGTGRPGTLWKKLISGEKLGVDIVDAHGHIGPSGGYVLEIQDEVPQLKRAAKIMDGLGVKTMIASGMQALMGDPVEGNDLIEQLMAPYGGRFLGYLTFNPCYAGELASRFKRYFSGKIFVGFKTLSGYWRVKIDDPRYRPMWEYADRHRLPILNHTWGRDEILLLKDVVGKYPDAQFLLGHSGGSSEGIAESAELARKNPNVHLEFCGSFVNTSSWEETLGRMDHRQVVFGTDAMVHDFNWEIGRLLSIDVPDNILADILGKNMRRILALRK